MTQVSRLPIRKEIEERMYEVFLDSVGMVRTKSQVEHLIDDLLSPTEKVMLAKRLSIALLLSKNYDQRTIAKILKVGLETVSKVNRSLRSGRGGYKLVTDTIIRNEKLHAFLQKVDEVINDIFPPKGRDWRQWRKDRYQEKLRHQKAF